MAKKTIKVCDLPAFEFWLGCFKPRNRAWQQKTLARLRKSRSIFETEEERQDKIKALVFLLGA